MAEEEEEEGEPGATVTTDVDSSGDKSDSDSDDLVNAPPVMAVHASQPGLIGRVMRRGLRNTGNLKKKEEKKKKSEKPKKVNPHQASTLSSPPTANLYKAPVYGSNSKGNKGSITKFVEKLSEDLSVSGFNASLTRELCGSINWKDLIRLIMVSITMGNNWRKLDKVNNKEVGEEVLDLIKTHNIKIRRGIRGNNSVLTLSRISQSYAPLTLKLRITAAKNLQSQYPNCPVVWQDMSLAGLPNKPIEYASYYIYMNQAIYDGDDNKDKKIKSKETLEKESLAFIQIAENGFKADLVSVYAPNPSNSFKDFQLYYGK
jgi:hypothetical protein